MSAIANDFEILDQEVTELHVRWNLLNDLFADEDAVNILNECAPSAFDTIRTLLIDSIILGISRIAADRTRQSLTLMKLKPKHDGTELGDSLTEILNSLQPLTDPLIKHRNERIAHHNKGVARRTAVLPQITKECIDNALQLIRDFMNEISLSSDGAAICYELPITVGDGTDILHALRYAQRFDSLSERAWRGEAPETLVEELKKH